MRLPFEWTSLAVVPMEFPAGANSAGAFQSVGSYYDTLLVLGVLCVGTSRGSLPRKPGNEQADHQCRRHKGECDCQNEENPECEYRVFPLNSASP